MKSPAHNSVEPLRVLLISPIPPPSGGIGRWTVLLRNWLVNKSSVRVRCVDISPRWRAVEDMRLWKRTLGGVLQGLRDAWRASLQLALFRPDVLHVNTSVQLRGPWDTVMLGIATIAQVRTVYHIRMGRMPELIERRGWEWWGVRWALKLASQIVVLDERSERALKAFLPAARVVRLPNAIDLVHVDYGSVVLERKSVLYAGHVIPTKGMRELMEAWRELKPQGWKLRLAGLGSTAYQRELLGIAGNNVNIEFIGDLPSEVLWNRMQAAEVFVLPTHTEGFPNVILEAMAAGKAIVTTRVGAIAEILDADGAEPCGMVIKPRDVDGLAAAIGQLLSDAQLRDILGRRARARVARCYSTDVVFSRLLEIWGGTPGSDPGVPTRSTSANGS